MSLPYVSGNWTLDSLHGDSVTTAKSISVTDVRPATEYTVSVTPPNKGAQLDADQALYYTDQTGAGLQSVGDIAIGRKAVQNIYVSSDIPAAARLPQVNGHKAHIQLGLKYKATNSVSGLEYEFPMKGSVTVTCPDWSAVPMDVLQDFCNHIIGVLCAGSGVATVKTVADILRGDLDITR